MEATLQKAKEIQPDKEAHSEKSNSKDDEVDSTAKKSDIVGNKTQVAKGNTALITAANITSIEAQIMSHEKQKNTSGESVQVPVAVLTDSESQPPALEVIQNKTITAPRQPKKRRNFSIKPEREYLDRVVTSWITKSDFVKDKNESMRKFSKRVHIHHNTIARAIAERLHPSSKRRRRGKPSLLDHDTMVKVCQVAQRNIELSGAYERKSMIEEVIKASGGKLTLKQATNTWTHTVHPFGKKRGLINGPMRRSQSKLVELTPNSKVGKPHKTPDGQLTEFGLLNGPMHPAKRASATAANIEEQKNRKEARLMKKQEMQSNETTIQHDKEMNCVYATLGVAIGGSISREHVDQLKTDSQVDAVAWCKFNRKVLVGTLAEKRESLKKLFEQNIILTI